MNRVELASLSLTYCTLYAGLFLRWGCEQSCEAGFNDFTVKPIRRGNYWFRCEPVHLCEQGGRRRFQRAFIASMWYLMIRSGDYESVAT